MNPGANKAINLDACIKCSACTARCPVAGVYPQFPGPKAVGPDAERFRLEGVNFNPLILNYCSNCKSCEVACPSGVNVTGMISAARRKSRGKGGYQERWQHRLRSWILGRAELLGKMGTLWPELFNTVLKQIFVRMLMEQMVGISRKAPLPAYQKTFRHLSTSGHFQLPADLSSEATSSLQLPVGNWRKVLYFPGCYATYNEPATAQAVVKILEYNGFEVIVPKFKCCGVPLEANGQFARAEANIQYNLSLMQVYLDQGLPLLTACTSCGLALKEEYPKAKAPGVERIGRQTYDLFEFLWELHEKGELREDFRPVSTSLGYHAPCHLKAQGIGTPSVRLLRLIPGVRIDDIEGGCCGMSGSYGFKAEKYDLAMEIGNPLFEKVQDGVRQGEFKEMVTECGVCKVQIEHGSGVPTRHPVWILLEAYGLVPKGI